MGMLGKFFNRGGKPSGADAPASPAPAPAATPAPVAPAGARKKLGKGFLVPVVLLLAGVVIVSQIVKQGGSLEDTARMERQRSEAEAQRQKELQRAVENPLAEAQAAIEQARGAAPPVPAQPEPGARVALPADGDAVLERRAQELEATWEEISRAKGGRRTAGATASGGGAAGASPAAQASAEAAEAPARPGFVGYVAQPKERVPGMAAVSGAPIGASPAQPSAPSINGVADYHLAAADQQRAAELRAAQRASRDPNTNWRNEENSSPAEPAKVNVAARIDARSHTVFAGTVINAVIEQAIDTALPGRLRARVTNDIYDSRTGQRLVIGRGAVLVGQYRSEITDGQERVFAVFERLVTPAGAVVTLGRLEAADPMGTTGIPGTLHTHFWKRMGIAALLALESAALERKVGVVAPGGSGGTGQISGAGQILVKTAEGELKRQYAIPPNITVPAGAVISLVLNDNVEVPAGLAR